MIKVTDPDHQLFMLNSDLIQYIHETPDTVIVLVTGESMRVLDSAEEVRQRIIEFRREIGACGHVPALELGKRAEKGADWHDSSEA
jgi:flagellar protein FlbD